MAAYNEITVARWQNLARRLFGLQGAGGNVPLLTPEIQPVIVLQPDTPEHWLLRDEHGFGQGVSQVGAAGVRATCGFFNPSTSNKIVTVHRAVFSAGDTTPALSTVNVTLAQEALVQVLAGFTLTLRGQSRDTRRRIDGAVQFWIAQPAAGVGNQIALYRFGSVSGSNLFGVQSEVRDIVLSPGEGLAFQDVVAGATHAIWVSAEWVERNIQDESELRV